MTVCSCRKCLCSSNSDKRTSEIYHRDVLFPAQLNRFANEEIPDTLWFLHLYFCYKLFSFIQQKKRIVPLRHKQGVENATNSNGLSCALPLQLEP